MSFFLGLHRHPFMGKCIPKRRALAAVFCMCSNLTSWARLLDSPLLPPLPIICRADPTVPLEAEIPRPLLKG